MSRKPLFLFVYILARILKPKIVLTYNNQAQCDGTGAQIQRIFAIFSLAQSLNLKYLHAPIQDVSVHPLDPHQTMPKYREYLDRLNAFIELPSDLSHVDMHKLSAQEIPDLDFRRLIYLICTPWRGFRLVRLINTYSVVDCMPGIYRFARQATLSHRTQAKEYSPDYIPIIAIHYRSVPGDYSIYNGESQTRQLQLSRMRNVLDRAVKDSGWTKFGLRVYTDAPERDLIVEVFPGQEHLWAGTPGFSEGKFHLTGRDLNSILHSITSRLEIIVGGDPLEAIEGMASAEILITSKSSLSYVSAILSSKNQIYSPFEFWHPIPNSKGY